MGSNMPPSSYWADKYVENKRTAREAIGLIKPAQRVFIGSSCGEPQHLVRELSEASDYFKDIEINRLLTLETTPLTLIANKTKDQNLNIRSFYLGSAKPKAIARLIEDGSTMDIGLGSTHQATLLALADKNDLGIHTEYMTNDIMHLFSRGVITNRKKGFNEGKMVASGAIGTEDLYQFLNDNPAIEFHPSDYVNDPSVIARHDKMVSMKVAMSIDLTGQVAADALPYNHFSGVTGMLDFMRGAVQPKGGKSILLLSSTDLKGKKSRIVPQLGDEAVVIPRGDVHYVVSEYGAVNLFGKSLQERAMAMISIAHPDFRDELFYQAQKMGLLSPERTLSESIHGVYPIRLEETIEIDGERVTIRPAKPVDERRIQEHFYNLEKDDIIARFFHEKTSFVHDEVKGVSLIDYIKDLTILAVVGEFGFGTVIGIGEYLVDPATNEAEIAFSISKPYQQKGLGTILLNKLAYAARENGISGLMAYTSPQNKAMNKLFRRLPYKVESFFDGDMLRLSFRFDQPL